MRKSLIIIYLAFILPSMVMARDFTNYPSYASTPLEHWPKTIEYEKMIQDFTVVYQGLAERSYVSGDSPQVLGFYPATAGTRWPYEDVDKFKGSILEIADGFIDADNLTSIAYLDANYPYGTNDNIVYPPLTNLLINANLPANYLVYTPHRCLNNVGPYQPELIYGVAGLKNIMSQMKYSEDDWSTVWTGAVDATWCSLGYFDSWSEAKSEAESNKPYPYFVDAPRAFTTGDYSDSSDIYAASAYRTFSYLTGCAATNVLRKGKYYVFADKTFRHDYANTEFAGNGDVTKEGWNVFESADWGKDDWMSVPIGNPDLPIPEWCTAPDTTNPAKDKGYRIYRGVYSRSNFILWEWKFTDLN